MHSPAETAATDTALDPVCGMGVAPASAAASVVHEGILYPFFGMLISPIWASATMTLSSLSVILNSLRLRNLKL